MLRSARLDALRGLSHALTTRDVGSIGPASDATALALRARVVGDMSGTARQPVSPHQVHGSRVVVVDERTDASPEADGVATTRRDVPLMVQGADCPLLALYDPDASALALVHSGWRGTVARIAANAVDTLHGVGARAERLHAAVFPGIGACCFEVGPEVVAAVRDTFGDRAVAWCRRTVRDGHALLDLHAAIVATLVEAGVDERRIDVVAGCTACGGRLWSHRASGGGPGRHGLFAVLRA